MVENCERREKVVAILAQPEVLRAFASGRAGAGLDSSCVCVTQRQQHRYFFRLVQTDVACIFVVKQLPAGSCSFLQVETVKIPSLISQRRGDILPLTIDLACVVGLDKQAGLDILRHARPGEIARTDN